MPHLVPVEERAENWPKVCQQSWIPKFTEWSIESSGRQLSQITIKAVLHSMQCNLLYIEELEKWGAFCHCCALSGETPMTYSEFVAYQLEKE